MGSNPTTHPKLLLPARAVAAFALTVLSLPVATPAAPAPASEAVIPEAVAPATSPPSPLEVARQSAGALTLAGLAVDAAGFEFSRGRMTVRFSKGSAVDVRDGSGTVGVFVQGEGMAILDTGGALAPGAFERNLEELAPASARARRKRGAALPPAQAAPAQFGLSWALVLLSEGVERSLATGPPGAGAGGGGAGGTGPDRPEAGGAVPASLRGAFDAALQGSNNILGWDFPARRIGSLLEGTSALTLAHFEGRTRLVYRADAARGTEELGAVTGTQDGRRQAEPIGQFPLGPALLSPPGADPKLVLEEAALTLHLGEPPSLAVTADLALRAGLLPARLLSLHLDRLESLRESLPAQAGEQIQVRAQARLGGPGIRVSAVRDAAGAPLDFAHSGNTLLVALASAPRPGERFRLTVTLDTDLARLPAGYEFFTLRTNGWLPIPENQYDRFGVTWDIRSHAPFLPLAGGIVPAALITGAGEAPPGGDPFRLAGSLPVPVRLPLLACGKFIGTGADALLGKRRVPVSVWSYAARNPQAEPIARYCAGALVYFSKLFGPYLFDRLDVVESVQSSGGLSGPGILMVEGMDVAEIAWTRRILGSAAFNMIFAHETAHQWWGQKIAVVRPEDQWMIEALAEYSAWLYVREVRTEFGERVLLEWNRRSAASSDIVPIGEAWALSGELARLHRANLAYGKGALMLRALSKKAGEEKFLAALGAFAQEFSGRSARPADLLATLTRETGADLAGDWSRWVDRTGQ